MLLEHHYRHVIEIDMPELATALAHCTMAAQDHDDVCIWFFENMETRMRYDWDYVLPRYFAQLQDVPIFVTDATNHLRLKRNGFRARRLWPFHTMQSILRLKDTLDTLPQTIKYHFTSLTNNRSDSRYLIHSFLHDHDLLSVTHWSYPEPFKSPYLCNLNKWAGIREPQYREFPSRWQPGTSHEQGMTMTDLDHHACAAITINTETTFHGVGPAYGGKMFKVMMVGRPFIEVSTAGTLADLHDLGFETFGDFIDESYDLIADPFQRIDAICREIQRLSKIPLIKLVSYIYTNRDRFQHNFQRCQELRVALDTNDLDALIMPDFRDVAQVVDRDGANY